MNGNMIAAVFSRIRGGYLKNKKSLWKIPSNASDFFDPHYDDSFKKRHPVLHFLTFVGIVVCVCCGPFLFIASIMLIENNTEPALSALEMLFFLVGLFSSFGFSVSLSNLFLILHKQYLGHFVTLAGFAVGLLGGGLSALAIWFLR